MICVLEPGKQKLRRFSDVVSKFLQKITLFGKLIVEEMLHNAAIMLQFWIQMAI